MALASRNPFTIILSGPHWLEDQQYPIFEAMTPGHLVEYFDDGGATKIRKNSSATAVCPRCVIAEKDYMNKGIDDAYTAGDSTPRVVWLQPGCVWYGLIASGQNIQNGELLQSAGDGTLKVATAATAAANVACFQSLTNAGNVTVLTRIRVQVIY